VKKVTKFAKRETKHGETLSSPSMSSECPYDTDWLMTTDEMLVEFDCYEVSQFSRDVLADLGSGATFKSFSPCDEETLIKLRDAITRVLRRSDKTRKKVICRLLGDRKYRSLVCPR
jgi:hypothetical protein